jgi:hypothetical protein
VDSWQHAGRSATRQIGHNEAPIEPGCLLCGVGYQVLPAKMVEQLGGHSAASREIWTMWKITLEQMGGRSSPVTLVGHLCRICDAAVSHVGAMGPTALERALVAHIASDQLGMLGYESARIQGLVGWGVAAYGDSSTLPAEKAFAHLPDLGELPGKLRSVLGG